MKLSNIKRRNITQVKRLWRQYSKKRNRGEIISLFRVALIKNGWENINGGEGSYKDCLMKNSIIVKFPFYYNDEAKQEIKREYEQFIKATTDFKRYLPTIHAFLDGLVLVQDRVMKKCSDYNTCQRLYKISEKHPLQDICHNHGHTLKGNVKFFDWVYNRETMRLENPEMPIYDCEK